MQKKLFHTDKIPIFAEIVLSECKKYYFTRTKFLAFIHSGKFVLCNRHLGFHSFDVPYIFYSKFSISRACNLQTFQSGPWWRVCQLRQRSLAWHTANVIYFSTGESQSLAQEKRTFHYGVRAFIRWNSPEHFLNLKP